MFHSTLIDIFIRLVPWFINKNRRHWKRNFKKMTINESKNGVKCQHKTENCFFLLSVWRRFLAQVTWGRTNPHGELKPGVNFINILQPAFTRADSKSARNIIKLSVFFALSWSGHVKAACKMLMKLTPMLLRKIENVCQQVNQNLCGRKFSLLPI